MAYEFRHNLEMKWKENLLYISDLFTVYYS